MVGITSYGAYVPYYRLARSAIAGGGRAVPVPGERAVANWDEDSITMAVAAGIDCLHGIDSKKPDGLYFASTTCPYRERHGAGIVAAALDLRHDIRVGDLTDSLRAGTIALNAALDAVKAGTAKSMMTVASECRRAGMRSPNEAAFGDGAAALLVGDDSVIATWEGSHAVSQDLTDVWRTEQEEFSRAWEGRWIRDEGHMKFPAEAVSGLLAKCKLTPKDIAKAAFYSPDPRTHAYIGRSMGFEPAQMQDSLFMSVGDTGAALPLMILVSALEEAKPGDKIVVCSYGNGAEALLFQVTDEIEKVRDRRAIQGHLAIKRPTTYENYTNWRDLVSRPSRPSGGIPVSLSALWRSYKEVIPLYGSKCKKCGTPQYPPQRVCAQCFAIDEMEDYRFADKKASVFTFTHDNQAASFDPPATVAVVDFEGGGRGAFNMTDRDPDEVKWDMPVEMTFRKKSSSTALVHYYWKVKPAR